MVAIGGSAGSLQTIIGIIESLPAKFDFSIIIVIHRLRNVASDMTGILSDSNRNLKIREPEDKTPIKKNFVYLAPQNYHLLIEEDKIFSLDYSEPVNHSRPSVDVTFDCMAQVYKDRAAGIILSGANNDGAAGLAYVAARGGVAIAQLPDEAEYPQMPRSAIAVNKETIILRSHEIIEYVQNLTNKR